MTYRWIHTLSLATVLLVFVGAVAGTASARASEAGKPGRVAPYVDHLLLDYQEEPRAWELAYQFAASREDYSSAASYLTITGYLRSLTRDETVQLGDLSIEITPKLPMGHVFFMLSYALGNRKDLKDQYLFKKDDSILEAVIPSIIANTGRALRRGVLQGYRSEDASLTTVRGRIRFDEQLRRRLLIVPPIVVRYDEYTEDIDENRLIKAAIAHLGRLRIRDRTR